jgi:uncharacterized protein YjbJ (UPF0337 family)
MTNPHTDIQNRAPGQPATTGQVAGRSASDPAEVASSEAHEAAGTVREQAGHVVDEAKTQVRSLAEQTRERLAEQARTQNERLVAGTRQIADELEEMARYRGDSPASTVVSKIADGGRKIADHLSERGPDGVLAEVQDFAQRRPGAFLAVAVTSGFVIGRLGKGVLGAMTDAGPSPTSQAPASQIGPLPGAQGVPPVQPSPAQQGYVQPVPGGVPSTAEPSIYADEVAIGTAPPAPASYREPVVDPDPTKRYRSGGPL